MKKGASDSVIAIRRRHKPAQYVALPPPHGSKETDWRVQARTVFWSNALQRWATEDRGPALQRGLTEEQARAEAALMNGERP